MRYGLSIVVLLCAALTGVSVSAQTQTGPLITTNPALERLTVPPELLPDGCQLAPRSGKPFDLDSNPVITKDSRAFGLLAGFVEGVPNTELEAKLEAVTDRAEGRRIYEEWMREQAARIEAAYTAAYLVEDDREIMVWALLFKEGVDHQQTEGPTMFGRQGHRMTKESMVITVWTDGEDRSCYEAVLRFVEHIE